MENNESGPLGKLIRAFILIVCFVFLIAMVFVIQPQDLSDIEGYQASEAVDSRDLDEVLKKAIEGNYSVAISEGEINEMLKQKLACKQGGALSSMVSLKSVLVRLKEDVGEVIVVREVFGRELTTSMYLQVEQVESEKGISTKVHLHGGSIHKIAPSTHRGGQFGKLTIPQGFLLVVMPDFKKIAKALSPEIDSGFGRMAKFKIGDKRLTLDPRRPTRAAEETPGSF